MAITLDGTDGITTTGLTSSGIDDNATSTAITIDASENVGIGTTSPAASLHINETGTTGTDQDVFRASTASGGGFNITCSDLSLANPEWKLRTFASEPLAFQIGLTEAMRIDASGNVGIGNGSIGTNGTTFYIAGAMGIRFGSTTMSPTDSSGNGADNQKDLGAATIRWDDVYATNGTIQTSDANEKQDIEALSDAEARVAVAAKGLLRKFRWKDAVEEKGDDARIHFGIIAQDLKAAFEAEGLDAGRYGMFIHTTWTDEETGEEHSRMGVRYSELLAFIISAI